MAVVAPLVAQAPTQQLLHLHVREFTMSAAPSSLRVGETLVLKIVTRVDENVLELDEVTLPDLSGFESLGDERRCSTAYRGSLCVETMTLTPVAPGERTIAGATLEAVDARNGRPTRFATNSVTVHIEGQPLPNLFLQAAFEALRLTLGLLALCAIVYAAVWAWLRRARRPRPVEQTPPLESVAPSTPAQAELEALVAALAERRTRAAVLEVRRELRARVGAREEETLSDLLARNATGGRPDLTAALRAVERAAFVDEAELPAAVAAALEPLRALVLALPPAPSAIADPVGAAPSWP